MDDEAVIYIVTYGRAEKVITYDTLRKHGYTGRIYLICSTDDKALPDYQERYGSSVLTFNKDDYKGGFDIGDNFDDKRVVVYARNAVFDIAKEHGHKYFFVFDDDYNMFAYKFNEKLEYHENPCFRLDDMLDIVLNFYKKTNALTIAMAQNGDFIGGGKGSFGKELKLRRKAMNTFLCSTDRPFNFVGRINEDVNTYVLLSTQGHLFFTLPNITINQKQTQSNSGGLTEFYLDGGTYIKSFYTVLYAPSCCTVTMMGDKNRRLHHRISWNNCTPKIISDKLRK